MWTQIAIKRQFKGEEAYFFRFENDLNIKQFFQSEYFERCLFCIEQKTSF